MIRYTSKLSQKGQIVLPGELQVTMDIEDGDIIQLLTEDEVIELVAIPSWVEQTRGSLATNNIQIEPEQMESLIEAISIVDTFQRLGEPS